MMRIVSGNSFCPWVVVVLWLMRSVAWVSAQDEGWATAITAGVQALQQGHYAEATRQLLAIAETLKPDDPRLTTSLMHLATLYRMQGQYVQAEPLYQRVLTLQEQVFGPEHPQLVEVLEAYASLQRRMHPVRSLLPWSAANRMATRAQRIQEREAHADAYEPPGAWSDYEEAAIFRDGS
jgi:hypothetical protein